jgi:glycosyltransferase involved in cell wall biosynthesis
MLNPFISIVLRTKDEVYWLGKCISEIYNQKYKNFEIILVDNSRTNQTKFFVKKNFPKVKILTYKSKNFLPGKAINIGIRSTKGSFVVITSGHCIPKDNVWLTNLVKAILKNRKIAGVYGKQEPLEFSDPNDVRDLIYIFGKDKKVQIKDPFFHNANSIIRKDLWKKIKFDENTHHIEDRIWAEKIQSLGYKIVYDPKPCVLHHGINHRHNLVRSLKISKILRNSYSKEKKREIIAITSIINPISNKKEKFLIEDPINELLKLKSIKKIFIICDEKLLKNKFNDEKIIFIKRDKKIDKNYLGLDYFLKETLKRHIIKKYKSTHVLLFLETYPNRPKNYFENLIEAISDSYDSVIPFSNITNNNLWKKNDFGLIEPLFKTTLPSSIANYKIYQEIKGLGSIIKTDIFKVSGAETSNIKPIFIDSLHSFKINKYTENFFKNGY